MAQVCGDKMMFETFEQGKDFYAMIASLSFHRNYEDCLEFYPEGTPLYNYKGKWLRCKPEQAQKFAGHKTDTNTEGKSYRTRAKSVLLGILYGRGDASIAEQLNCSLEEAREIKDAVYKGFPAIEKFEQDSIKHAKDYNWVSTLWGRKRRLPDINLPEYEVFEAIPTKDGEYVKGDKVDEIYATPIINKVRKAFFNQRRTLIEELKKKGYYVVSNGGKIAQARRQVVNSIVQGCLKSDTLITTREYGVVQIKQVVGEHLHVWDGEDWTEADITYSGKKQLCKLFFSVGTHIECSPNHKFLVKSDDGEKFLETRDLVKLFEDGALIKLDSKAKKKYTLLTGFEITTEFVDMYDVCNTERGYFVANGVVTHNSAADMSKKALIKLNGDDRLNALHAKPIIPIHDEVILSAPFRYAREVEKRFAYDMETAATDKLHLDISTDVEVTFNWYGESLDLDKELKDFEEEVGDTLVK